MNYVEIDMGTRRVDSPVQPTSLRMSRGLLRRANRFARSRNLKLATALRILVTERLDELDQDAQLTRAEKWQRAQAWGTAKSLVDGSAREVSWDDLRADYQAAVRSARKARAAS